MVEIGKSETGRDEGKKSDQVCKNLEAEVPHIAKPFSQWTLAEKRTFCKAWPFNNFWNNAPGGGYSIKESFEGMHGEGSFSAPFGEICDARDVTDDIVSGKHSGKFFSESREQFCENVKQALIAEGVDIKTIQQIVKEKVVESEERVAKVRKIVKEGKDDFAELLETEDQATNTSALMELMLLPAALRLLDEGYTLEDLSE